MFGVPGRAAVVVVVVVDVDIIVYRYMRVEVPVHIVQRDTLGKACLESLVELLLLLLLMLILLFTGICVWRFLST